MYSIHPSSSSSSNHHHAGRYLFSRKGSKSIQRGLWQTVERTLSHRSRHLQSNRWDIPDNTLTKKFKSTSALYELHNQWNEAGELLENQCAIMNDPSSSNTKVKTAIRTIERFVLLPLIPITQFIIKDGADKLSPKGGGRSAQRWLDTEMKRTLEETGEYKKCREGVAVLLQSYLEK